MRSSLSRGIFWMGGLKGVTRVATFVRLAILARLLSPIEFGLFGVATLALALLETLTDSGINVFFIQKEGELDEYRDTAWVFSILRGILIFAVLFIFSNFIANFFHSPTASILIKIIAVGALLRGFINPTEVIFQKQMEFHKEFYFRTAILVVDYGTSIILGIITKSAVALVVGMVAGIIVELILSHVLIKPCPKLIFNKEKLKKVFGRGKWITAAGIFQYLFGNGDNMVVGRLMDTISLGYYQMAYRISIVPLTEIGDVFSKVTFPVYADISHDVDHLKKLFYKSLLIIFLITSPIGVLLLLFTKEIVLILLGVTWLPIIPALKVLSLFGVVRALQWSFNSFFLALKKQEYVTYVTLVSVLGLAATIVPLVSKYGILGASVSALFGMLISLPVTVYFYLKTIKK